MTENPLKQREVKPWEESFLKALDYRFKNFDQDDMGIIHPDEVVSDNDLIVSVLNYCSEHGYSVRRTGPLWIERPIVLTFEAYKGDDALKIYISNRGQKGDPIFIKVVEVLIIVHENPVGV